MDRETFLKRVAERFYPALRGEGFKGSGSTLRRIQEPMVHVVNLQGSSSADGFYVNLGAHLTFLPMEGGGTSVPGRLKEYECAFRDRIDPPPGPLPGRWPYGDGEDEAEAIVSRLAEEWARQGHRFFTRYSSSQDRLGELVREALSSHLHAGDGLTYARAALWLGLREDAATLARQALERVPEKAVSLRATLKRFLEELEASPR